MIDHQARWRYEQERKDSHTPDRTLIVPQLSWPYYWELEVGRHTVGVRLCKRSFYLTRTAITSEQYASVFHDDDITSDYVLDKIEEEMTKMADGFVKNLARKLAQHVPAQVKVKVDK